MIKVFEIEIWGVDAAEDEPQHDIVETVRVYCETVEQITPEVDEYLKREWPTVRDHKLIVFERNPVNLSPVLVCPETISWVDIDNRVLINIEDKEISK